MALVQRLSRMRMVTRLASGLSPSLNLARPGASSRAAGFTLVELIVVIIVLGILAVVALPRLTGFTMDEYAFRDQVKSAIQFARKSAVNRRRVTCVDIDDTTVTLTAAKDVPPAGCTEPLPLPGSNQHLISIPDNLVVTPTLSLEFDASGRTATATQTLTVTGALGDTATLMVEGWSGYAHD